MLLEAGFTQLIGLNPDAHFRMAQCLAKMKRFSEAVAALNKSVETLEASPAVEPRGQIQ